MMRIITNQQLNELASHGRLKMALGFVLFVLVFWTFAPGLDNDFIGYDDSDYVTANGHVQQGLSWDTLRWAFSTSEAANWHPVTWLSHSLDCQVFGLQPSGHHLTSILLHIINSILLFLVFSRMTGAPWPSFIVALLFGLHPLRVESVAWIAERKDVLSTTFWMLTLWGYAKYVEASQMGESKVQSLKSKVEVGAEVGSGKSQGAVRASRILSSRRYYILTLAFFVLGLMSKPMLVTLPFVLLLLDFWPLGRIQIPDFKSQIANPGSEIGNFKFQMANLRRLAMEKLPFFLAAVAASGITFLVQKQGGAMSIGLPLSARIENALISYCRYLGKIFWPTDLAAFYPLPNHWPLTAVLGAAALLIAISASAIILGRPRPYILVGWLWFIGTLVPVIGLVKVGEQAMADRYSYIPSIGIVLLLVWGVAELMQTYRWPIQVGAIPAAGLAFLCIGLTRQQTRFWKNDEILFGHALLVTRNNHLAHAQLGAAFDRQGRLDEAMSQFQEALRERPDYPGAHNNLGIVLDKQGHYEEAIKEFSREIEINPTYADPHNNLGSTLEKQGRLDDALSEYEKALKLKPLYADAHYNRGIALGRKGRLDDAIMEFQAALRIQPNSADAHNNLGVMLDQKGRLDEAIAHYLAAIEWKPNYAKAHFNLGVACARKGLLDDAQHEFEVAVRLKPDYTEAGKNLATVLELKRTGGK